MNSLLLLGSDIRRLAAFALFVETTLHKWSAPDRARAARRLRQLNSRAPAALAMTS